VPTSSARLEPSAPPVAPRKIDGGAQDAPPPEDLTRPEVRAMQQLLQRLGYDPGPVDGIVGPQTIAAMRAFANDRNLQQDQEALALLLELRGG
jgi:peptidoglycan hydrolase-like protein with peptidoglycan-binding domain